MLIHARPNCAEWNIHKFIVTQSSECSLLPSSQRMLFSPILCHSLSLSLPPSLSVSLSICSSNTSLYYSFLLSLPLYLSISLPQSLYSSTTSLFLPLSLHICSFAFFSPFISLPCEYLSPSRTNPTFIIPSSSGRWMVSRFSLLVMWTHGLEHRELEAKVLYLPSY